MYSNTYHLSQHAELRAVQRAIPDSVIELLLEYGESKYSRGCKIYYLTNSVRKKLSKVLDPTNLKALEKKKNCYVVLSDDEEVVTVGYRYKRILN